MKAKGIILFDIDHVLINTEMLRPFLKNVDEEKWQDQDLPFKDSVYEGAIEIIKRLQEDFELGIFSECGNLPYQNRKLSESGLRHFFNPNFIFITRSKERDARLVRDRLAGKYKKVVFIDDRLDQLKALKQVMPKLITIRVLSPKYINQKSDHKPDFQISKLSEIFNALEKIGV